MCRTRRSGQTPSKREGATRRGRQRRVTRKDIRTNTTERRKSALFGKESASGHNAHSAGCSFSDIYKAPPRTNRQLLALGLVSSNRLMADRLVFAIHIDKENNLDGKRRRLQPLFPEMTPITPSLFPFLWLNTEIQTITEKGQVEKWVSRPLLPSLGPATWQERGSKLAEKGSRHVNRQ